MLTMYKQITIKTLDKQGVKHACIARELSCHRNTVTNILKKEKLTEKQTRVKPSIFAAFDTRIEEYLDKKVANLRIYEILKEEYGVQSTYVISVNTSRNISPNILKHMESRLHFQER